MYIKYTFVHFATLLIRQILGAVLLPVTGPFAVEALSLRLRARLGLLHLSNDLFAILLEVPLLPFAIFLKLLSTHILTSPLTSFCLFYNSRFELLLLATEPVSNTEGLLRTLVKYTSIICISNIPLFTSPSFLSAKYLGQFRF